MHRIYALWSHPRSMSTALERVMRERGDLDCAHEPFMYDYYVHRAIRQMPHFDIRPDHPVSYQAIRDHLIARAQKAPVFFKDMSYYVMPHITRDPVFAPHLVNIFLIRDPMASIASYHRLDPEVTLEEIGLEAQWRHYSALVAAGKSPVVIRAEAVQADTRGMMVQLWQAVGLPFRAGAFDWQSERPKDWDQVGGWHGDVSASKGIRPPGPDDAGQSREKFQALAQSLPRMHEHLAHHQPFYEQLLARAMA